jgi:hypothetical protein
MVMTASPSSNSRSTIYSFSGCDIGILSSGE